MQRFSRCLLLLIALGLTSVWSSNAHALFGGDIVYDPTNYTRNVITAQQMVRQVQQMMLQVKYSKHAVDILLQNLLPALGLRTYPLGLYETLLLADNARAGRRPYSARTLDYYHDDLQPTSLTLYPGVRSTPEYPVHYGESADTLLNTTSSVMGRLHDEAGEEADVRYHGSRDGLVARSEAAVGQMQAMQTGNAMTLSVADGVHRLEKSNAEVATLIATRNAHDVQKEAWGEAIFRESLLQAGANGANVPAYASGAPGAVKYFDLIGG